MCPQNWRNSAKWLLIEQKRPLSYVPGHKPIVKRVAQTTWLLFNIYIQNLSESNLNGDKTNELSFSILVPAEDSSQALILSSSSSF